MPPPPLQGVRVVLTGYAATSKAKLAKLAAGLGAEVVDAVTLDAPPAVCVAFSVFTAKYRVRVCGRVGCVCVQREWERRARFVASVGRAAKFSMLKKTTPKNQPSHRK